MQGGFSVKSKPETLIEVPNVIGKSAFQANAVIVNAGLNIIVDGSLNVSAGSGATVISQTPAAGSTVEVGTVVSVTLRHVGETDN